jgi:hypothetical protein
VGLVLAMKFLKGDLKYRQIIAIIASCQVGNRYSLDIVKLKVLTQVG